MRNDHKGIHSRSALKWPLTWSARGNASFLAKCVYQKLIAFITSFTIHGKTTKHIMVIKIIHLWNGWKEKQHNAPWMSKPQNLLWRPGMLYLTETVQQTPQAHAAAEHIWMLQVYLERPLQVGGQDEIRSLSSVDHQKVTVRYLAGWGQQSDVYTSDTITTTQTPLSRELTGYLWWILKHIITVFAGV